MKFSLINIAFILMFSTSITANTQSDHVESYKFSKKPETCMLNENCFLPKCNCQSTRATADLTHHRRNEIPQLVILSIDDDQLDKQSYRVYKKLFLRLQGPQRTTSRTPTTSRSEPRSFFPTRITKQISAWYVTFTTNFTRSPSAPSTTRVHTKYAT